MRKSLTVQIEILLHVTSLTVGYLSPAGLIIAMLAPDLPTSLVLCCRIEWYQQRGRHNELSSAMPRGRPIALRVLNVY